MYGVNKTYNYIRIRIRMWPQICATHILLQQQCRYSHIQKGAAGLVQLVKQLQMELDAVLDSSPSTTCGGAGEGSCSDVSFLHSLVPSLLERECPGKRLLERLRLRLRLERRGVIHSMCYRHHNINQSSSYSPH